MKSLTEEWGSEDDGVFMVIPFMDNLKNRNNIYILSFFYVQICILLKIEMYADELLMFIFENWMDVWI